ncbi:MAG: c-type cytochrome, partial [Acidobacteria bacterium]|nr:c-type cytochrome [Acidobacteriota bacterium]
MQRRRRGGGAGVLVWMVLLGAAALTPPDAAAQLDAATFTAAEADAGRAAYDRACASCHMPNLSGSFEAPELAGPTFRGGWGGQSAAALVEFVAATMPPDSPGSLAPADYERIVAYVLQENGFPAGDVALSAAPLPAATPGGAAGAPPAAAPLAALSGRPGAG